MSAIAAGQLVRSHMKYNRSSRDISKVSSQTELLLGYDENPSYVLMQSTIRKIDQIEWSKREERKRKERGCIQRIQMFSSCLSFQLLEDVCKVGRRDLSLCLISFISLQNTAQFNHLLCLNFQFACVSEIRANVYIITFFSFLCFPFLFFFLPSFLVCTFVIKKLSEF